MKMNKEKYEGLQFLFVVDKCTLHTYPEPITYAKKRYPKQCRLFKFALL